MEHTWSIVGASLEHKRGRSVRVLRIKYLHANDADFQTLIFADVYHKTLFQQKYSTLVEN